MLKIIKDIILLPYAFLRSWALLSKRHSIYDPPGGVKPRGIKIFSSYEDKEARDANH